MLKINVEKRQVLKFQLTPKQSRHMQCYKHASMYQTLNVHKLAPPGRCIRQPPRVLVSSADDKHLLCLRHLSTSRTSLSHSDVTLQHVPLQQTSVLYHSRALQPNQSYSPREIPNFPPKIIPTNLGRTSLDLSKDLLAIFFQRDLRKFVMQMEKPYQVHFLNYFTGFSQAQSPCNIL